MAAKSGDKVVVNVRTKRTIPFVPSAPGREPAPGRDDPFKHNADGWTKTMADHYAEVCPKHLWRVHGKLYDLSEYMDVHPGGRVFLEHSRGSDCTEAYECHHLRTEVVNNVLKNYLVPEPDGYKGKTVVERFEYDQNFRPIKKFVAEYMAKQLKNPTGKTPFWAGIMYLAAVIQFLLISRLAAKRKSYFLLAVAGILCTGCWGTGHTHLHRGRKNNPWAFLRFAMELTGWSSYDAAVTHAMSHHQNPNTQYDIEVYNLQAIGLYFLTNEPKNSIFPLRLGLFALHAMIVSPFLYITRMIDRVLKRDIFKPDVIIPNLYIAMMGYYAKSLKEGFKMTMVVWAVFSMWFVPSSFAAHHAMDPATGAPLCYHDGEPEDFQRDYAAHQIVSSLDHSPGMNEYLSLTFFAQLNCHIIHHIFPTIDRIHHGPLLEALLKENPGNFRELYHLRNKVGKNFWTELFPSVFQFIRERRFNLLGEL